MELVCRDANKIAVKWCDEPVGIIYLTEYSSLAGDILWTGANIVSLYFALGNLIYLSMQDEDCQASVIC